MMFLLAAMNDGAWGQETRESPKYGPLRLGPVFLTPRLGFSAGVDSNVYNTQAPVSDESLAATPSLQAVLPITRRARIKGTGGVTPQYFRRESSQRYMDVFGSSKAEVDVGPVTLFAGVGGGRYRQRFSLEIDERIRRHESTNVVGGTLRLGNRISTSASQLSVTSTYDPTASLDGNPVDVALDRQAVTRRLEVKLPLTRKTSLVPWVDLVDDRFLKSPTALPPHVTSQRYVVSLQFTELAFITGSIAAGIHRFGAGQGVVPYDGPVLAVDASMPFVFGTRLHLLSNRDLAYSATPLSATESIRNTYVSGLHRGEIRFELPFRLQARTSVSYAEARYLLPQDREGDTVPRRDHAWTVGGALLRRFGDHVSLGATVQRGRRISPVDGHTYAGVIYGLTGEVR